MWVRHGDDMKLSSIFSGAKRALETEQGRATGRKIADGAADAARRVAGERHGSKIDKAHGAARKYLDKGENGGAAGTTGTPNEPGPTPPR